MNIQQLRQSLKLKWLSYYEENRSWLVKMRVWGTYDNLRRPLSGFILATLSVLEPEFDEILAFILDLNNNPDEIVAALGLNFNPDEELSSINLKDSLAANEVESESLHEEPCEDKHVASIAVTKIPRQYAVSALNFQKPSSELGSAYKPVLSFTASTELARIQKPVPAIATATKITPQSSGRTPHSTKVDSSLLRQNQPVGSRTALLEISNDITSNRKSVRSLEITTEVPIIAKTLPASALATEFTVVKDAHSNGNGKVQPPDIPKKVNFSPSTNARSLASWVDEFCQGVAWDREEGISIK